MPGKPISLSDFPADKKITLEKTDIDLRCDTQDIDAEVTVEAVMSMDADSQAFTLYFDLTVDEVLTDGKTADFERSRDGLLVHFPNLKRAGERIVFVFRYHGYSLPCFPAIETTVQLNRSFPWIPWPGIKTAPKYENYFDYSESEAFFIEDWQRGDEVEYTLRYHGPGSLYTNLEPQGDGLYKGFSGNGISLYSGMVLFRNRGVDVYVPACLYKDASLYADALLDAYDPLLDLCDRMRTLKKPEKPRTIVVTQTRSPVINEFVSPQELWSRDNEWEIRQNGDTSFLISARKGSKTKRDYQNSTEIKAQMASAYVLDPCAGYPIDVSHSATRNFGAWLCIYLQAYGCDDGDLEYFEAALKEDYSGNGHEFINGIQTPETPLTQEEEGWISIILKRMHDGENFDEPFRDLYQRLLRRETVTASDMVSRLYHNKGV